MVKQLLQLEWDVSEDEAGLCECNPLIEVREALQLMLEEVTWR